MTNNKQITAIEWLIDQMFKQGYFDGNKPLTFTNLDHLQQQAKEMEKEQIGYSKEDVLTAGEMGEINTYDTKHIVSYLDEAKQFNETYGGNK